MTSQARRKRSSTATASHGGERPRKGQVEKARLERRVPKFLGMLGPGFITGASDDDPSGIGTYSMVGASLGLAPLWTTLVTFPMMVSIQHLSAKIGQVSGNGLGRALRDHYSDWVVYPGVLGVALACTINAGADISAIGAGVQLLVPAPIELVIVPVALGILALQIMGSYRLIASIFKWLALVLLAYVVTAFITAPDPLTVFRHTLVPTVRFDQEYIAALVAIAGTTISPYLWFWQASQEVEEEKSLGRRTVSQRKGMSEEERSRTLWDVNIGMSFSNLIIYFIILTTATTLHASGDTQVDSAAEAASALRPLAGDASSVLFAIGIIAAGILAVPVLTGTAAYAIADASRWRNGLDESVRKARRFYLVVTLSTLIALGINFLGINPMDALFGTALLWGLLTPPLLVLLFLAGNNRKVMGRHRNSPLANGMVLFTIAVMTVAAFAYLFTAI